MQPNQPIYCVILFFCLISLGAPTASAKERRNGLEAVILQLKWRHQFQFAGYYAAKEKGFFEDEGLDVRIAEGGPDVPVDRVVVSGQAQYGVLGSELIKKRSLGEPLVLLAVIFQHSVRALIVRADSNIHGPADLVGKLIMLNRNEDTEFMAMFRSEGIPIDRLRIIPKDGSANRKFLEGRIDALNGSIGNQPFLFQRRGVPVRLIRPISYGVDFYGDSLFTSETELKEHPQRVAAFRRAVLKGWDYAMRHPEELIEIILAKYNPQKSRAGLRYEAKALRKVILPDLVDIGHINPHRIERIAQMYAQSGLIPSDYTLAGFIYDPSKALDHDLIRRVALALGIIVFLALAGGTVLFLFNRHLKLVVQKRTDELLTANERLQREMVVRERAEEEIAQNERKFRRLLESTNTAPWELDLASKRFTYMGPQAEKILGYPLSSWVDRESWLERLHPEDRQGAVAYCDRETKKGRDHDFSCRAVHADGSIRWIHETVSVVHGLGGPEKLIGFMHDITERKQAEEEKRHLERQLRHLQKMEAIGTLAGGIAHDFNNILSAIIGYSELANQTAATKNEVNECIGEVLKAGKRAKELVKQILAFSRKTEQRLKPLLMGPVVKEALKMLRASIPTTIKIESEIAPESCPVMADPTQVHQVVMNLCTNAAQELDETGGVITVTLEETELAGEDLVGAPHLRPGRYLLFAVQDSGRGIPAELLERIFDPYFTTKGVGKGSGMGLSVVHGIVQSHGGIVRVKSEPRKGSIFRVFFPCLDESAEEDAALDGPLPTGQEHILLVDDEQVIVSVEKQLLEGLGYTVTAALGSAEALAVFERHPESFDLVITDQTMPVLTGLGLSKKLLALRPGLPIILCTGYSSHVDPESAKRAGIKGFLLKPFSRSRMAVLIRKVLAGEDVAGISA